MQIGNRLKDSTKTGSIKNRKVNSRRHVLTEETLDEIDDRLEHTPKNLLNVYHRKLMSVQRATTLMKLHNYTYCEYTHVRIMRIPV